MSDQSVPRVAFRAVLELHGKTATGIVVPAELVEQLGAGKRPPVRVTVAGHSYRSTVAVMGGRHLVGMSAENRAAAGVSAGDELEVELVLDAGVRTVELPADLAAALDEEPAARTRFEALSYSRQLAHALAVQGAKTEQTRTRRLAKVLDELRV